MNNLKDQVAILTGSARLNGVGAATARILAQAGCNILMSSVKNIEQAKQVILECQKYNVQAEYLPLDLTNSDNCYTLAEYAKQKWGRTDIIINCIGATKSANYQNLEQLDAIDFTSLFNINVTAPYLIVKAFAPLIRQSQSGVIINVSSAAGLTGKGSSIAYAAAKGGLNTLTLALAQALSPEVRVNAICPSFIDSSWWEELFAGKEDKYNNLLESIKQNNILNKVLKPLDVANTIVSLINNPVITGELIRLDAGAHIGKTN